MEKNIALRMLNAALALEKEIGDLDELVTELEAGAEREVLVRALGNIIGILSEDFVRRIARQHPELDPDR
jgi:hypothetical protein